jgi:hypothetical protein
MLRRADLETLSSSEAFAARGDQPTRRTLLLTTILASLPLALAAATAKAGVINPSETAVTLPDAIRFLPWSGGPAGTGEVAEMYGGLDKSGPYLAFMRWHPGYFSAPHMYRTDRISVVVSGTWWVNSGADFDPEHAVPVPAGGYVLRHAHTPHYDGVPGEVKEPAVIALFGMAPVDLQLVDSSKPAYRRV